VQEVGLVQRLVEVVMEVEERESFVVGLVVGVEESEEEEAGKEEEEEEEEGGGKMTAGLTTAEGAAPIPSLCLC